MSGKLVLAACLVLFAVGAGADGYTTMGDLDSYEEDGQTVVFNCVGGTVRVSFLREGLVRVHMSPSGVFPEDSLHLEENGPYAMVTYSWPGVSYQIAEVFDENMAADVYRIDAGELIVKVRKRPFKLGFYDAENRLLVKEKAGASDAGLGYVNSRVYETMELGADEHFFGGGGHNHALDMRGHYMTCYASELQNFGADGGFPVPFFMSSRGYGIFFNNLDDDVTLDMGTRDGEYTIEGTSGGMEGWDMDYYFIHGPRFEDILKRYTDIVGRPMLPEKWFFGHMQSKCCDWYTAEVVEVANKYRGGDWPCDVLIVDAQALTSGIEWSMGFSDPNGMFDVLDGSGFKMCLSQALHKNIYDWKVYDPTVKASWDDYWSLTAPRVNDGVAFWWQDNSERFPSYSGSEMFANGYESHELFGSLWAKNVTDGMEAMGLYGRPVLSRGGPIGGHRYIIPWPGDMGNGLDYLEVDLNFMRNAGLSAYPYSTVDLGGFRDNNPLEEQNVIRRMINIVPLVPICRAHGTGSDGAILPWQMTVEQQDLYRYYLKLRYRLHPYLYSSAIESHLTGRPMLGSLVFDYQDDVRTYDKDYHFMIGRQILVAPVMSRTEEWSVYLPQGRWVHYWSGRKYEGGQIVKVSAPLYGRDGLPMFVKSGAIIPMMPEMSYIYEKTREPITLDVYPDEGAQSSYVMYDCSDVRGPFSETTFTCAVADGNDIEISIADSDSAYELWVHCREVGSASVVVDGKVLTELSDKSGYDGADEGWYYGVGCFYGSGKVVTLNVKIPRNSGPHVIGLHGFLPLSTPLLPQRPSPVNLRVDIGPHGQRIKAGWIEWSESGDPGGSVSRSNLGGTEVDATIEKTEGEALGFRRVNNPDALLGELVHIDNSDGGLRLVLSDLEAGEYVMTTHHNVIWMSGAWDEIDIDVDGVLKVDNLRMSEAARDVVSSAKAVFGFSSSGDDVRITFTPQGVGPWRNVALNGFEIAEVCRVCGDFNGSGVVDFADLSVFVLDWLWSGKAGGYAWGDIDCDGRVWFVDFARFAQQWMGACP